MINRNLIFLVLGLLLAGCGMTRGQKAQISEFATSTSTAVDASVEQMISIRAQVIEIHKERIIMGDLQVTDKADLDKTLEADKVAKQVAAMRLLQDYANSLNALATNDQSEAISKSVTHLATSAAAATNAYKNEANMITVSDEQKKAAAGIAATIGGWYIEKQKKEAIKTIVDKYSPLVAKLAEVIEQDLSLIGNSPCWPEFRGGAALGTKPINDKKKSGTLDIFCTQADSLREHSLELLRCPVIYQKGHNSAYCATVTTAIRERALNDYLKMNHDMDDVASFSKKAAELIQKMHVANSQLSKVLEDDKFTADDIKAHATAIKELVTMIEVLAAKRKE